MQFHWGWAVLAALALGVGFWWTRPDGKPRARSDDPHGQDALHRVQANAESGPTLYRWVDAGGTVNFTTDPPPAGRKFSIVHIDPNRNIVPMGSSDSAAETTTKPH